MLGEDEFIMGMIGQGEEIGDIIYLDEDNTINDEIEVIN